jgi:hypothetical protein
VRFQCAEPTGCTPTHREGAHRNREGGESERFAPLLDLPNGLMMMTCVDPILANASTTDIRRHGTATDPFRASQAAQVSTWRVT